jgi:deoxyribodipyrimidine photo-lyase
LRGVGSAYAVEPARVTKADGTPYAVFTPYSRTWLGVAAAAGALEGPAETPAVGSVDWSGPGGADSGVLDPGPCSLELPPTSSGAVREQWERFHDSGLDSYDARRDLPAVEGTSRLSAALRWGIVHPRTLLADLRPERAHEVFRSELIWREFYADVLYRRPETAWRNLQPSMDAMPVDTDAAAHHRFAAWCAGRTGFPIVDAGMRQLLATGWMHNRVRMIVASFLVKDLHLPWQWGARHFMDHLVDGDLASNNHGWQWAAGTGTDAAPYFRVFNPTSQSERFDPSGEYIRRWVPELTGLPAAEIHQPGPLRRGEYPAPMVDHAAERDEALRRYRSLKEKTG